MRHYILPPPRRNPSRMLIHTKRRSGTGGELCAWSFHQYHVNSLAQVESQIVQPETTRKRVLLFPFFKSALPTAHNRRTIFSISLMSPCRRPLLLLPRLAKYCSQNDQPVNQFTLQITVNIRGKSFFHRCGEPCSITFKL